MEALLLGMRFIQFSSVLAMLGSALFACYAYPKAQGKGNAEQSLGDFVQCLSRWCVPLALFSATGWLSCEGALMSGNLDDYRNPAALATVLTQTQFGKVWSWRLLLLLTLSVALLARRKRDLAPWLLTLAAIVLTASLAAVGHSAMGSGAGAWLHLANQTLHLLAAGIWIGGLPALFFVMRAGGENARLATVLGRFSAVGFAAVLVLLTSGLINSWLLVGSRHALLQTEYGRVLLVKIVFVGGMVALALFNRLWLMPRLDTDGRGGQVRLLLLRSVAVEQIFAIFALCVVSLLGTLPPALGVDGM